MKRPTSLTVICWILVGLNVIALLGLAASLRFLDRPEIRQAMEASPIPIPVQIAFGIIGPVIMLIAAALMFKGKVLGRHLYVGWNIVGLTIGLITSPYKMAMLPGAIIFVVICALLFRPAVTAYLESMDAQAA